MSGGIQDIKALVIGSRLWIGVVTTALIEFCGGPDVTTVTLSEFLLIPTALIAVILTL